MKEQHQHHKDRVAGECALTVRAKRHECSLLGRMLFSCKVTAAYCSFQFAKRQITGRQYCLCVVCVSVQSFAH